MTVTSQLLILVAAVLGSLGFEAIAAETPDSHVVLQNGKSAPGSGFKINIDDAEQRRDWLTKANNSVEISYPGGLDWAAFMITVGAGVNTPRPGVDLSSYATLQIEMRGESGGECVMVGIKDYNDPDDGSEPKVKTKVTTDWKVFDFDIEKDFDMPRVSARLSALTMSKLYLVTELVFPCDIENAAQTIYVRNIKYVK